MTTTKNFDYKGFPVELNMSDYMGITFSCKSYHLRSEHREEHVNGGWEKPNEAIESIKKVIDTFISETPKDYTELAEAIQSSLIWTGYEDCYVEPKTLEVIIKNFLLTQDQ